mgnify:CR=1 FL=1
MRTFPFKSFSNANSLARIIRLSASAALNAFRIRNIAYVFAIVGLIAAAPTASAQLFWDPSAAGNGITGGSTTAATNEWRTISNAVWWNGAADVVWTDGSNATFGGTAGTVHLGSNITAGTLTFGTSGYVIDLRDHNNGVSTDAPAYALSLTGLSGSAGTFRNSATGGAPGVATLNLAMAANTVWGGSIGSGGDRMTVNVSGGNSLTVASITRVGGFGQTTLGITGTGTRLVLSGTGSDYGGNFVDVGAGATFDLGNNGNFTARSFSLNATGTITSTGTARIVDNNLNNASSLDGFLTGTLAVEQSDPSNTMTISNSGNTYSGGTFVNNGTLAVSSDAALGTGGLSIGAGGNNRFTMGFRSTLGTNSPLTITKNLGFAGNDRMSVVFGSTTTGDLTFSSPTASLGNSVMTEFDIQNANTAFQGNLTGTQILKKFGPGNLILSGNSSFSGGLYIARGLGGLAFTSAGTVIANNIGNAGANSSIGAGSNTISATAFAITTIADGGILRYAPINSVGGGATSTDRLFAIGPNGGTIDASGTGAINFTNIGTQNPERAAAATDLLTASGGSQIRFTNATVHRLLIGMTVTGTNIPGGTTITGIDTNTRLVTLSNNVTGAVASGAFINFGYGTRTMTLTGTNTDSNSIAGVLANPATGGGNLALTKSGVGTWVLGGANTYTGNTTVNAGTLNIVNASGLSGTPSVTIGTGGTLNYIASANSPMTTGAGSTLTITGGTGTAIGGSIGSTLTGAQMTFNGAATTTGAINVNVFGVPGVTGTTGTYTLVSAASGLNGGTYTLGNIFNNTNFTASNLQVTGTSITVDTVAATPLTAAFWNGSLGGGVWTQSDGSTTSNWQLASGSVVNQALIPTGVLLTFDNIGTLPANTTLGSNMAATGLVVTANNTGALNVSSGYYALTLGASGLSVANGAGAVSLGTNMVLGAAQTWTNNSTNLLALSGSVSGANNLTVAGTGNTTISGALATGAGTLTKSGAGTLTLSGANTYTGTTAVNNGTLALGGGNDRLPTATIVTLGSGIDSGILRLDGSSQQLAGLLTAGTGTGNRVVNGNATAAILTINNVSSFGGVLGGTGTNENNFALIKSGPGALTLTAANTFTGGTSVTGGSLILSGASNRLSTTGNITVNGSGTFLDLMGNSQTTSGTVTLNRGTLTNGTLTSTTNAFESISNGMIVSAVLNGSVGLNTAGTGDLILSAANTYTGTTNLGGTGKIRINNISSLGTGTLSFNGGILELNANLGIIANAMTATSGNSFRLDSAPSGFSATFSGNLTGDATNGLIKSGNGGTITLSGTNNTFTGNTTITGGRIALGNALALQNSTLDTTGGNATTGLNVTGFTTPTLGGLAGNVDLALTITGFNAVTQWTLNPQSGTRTYSGVFANGSVATSLVKTGAGTQVFSGANTYTGATIINNGTLNVTGTLGNTAVTVNTGGTYNVGLTDTVAAVTLAGGTISNSGGAVLTGSSYAVQSGTVSGILGGAGALTKTTAGTVTLSGANTYTGATTVSAGTLVAANAAALGTVAGGATVTSGATLDVQANIGTEALNVGGTGAGGNGALITSTGTGTVGGAMTLSSTANIGGAGTLNIDGVISGATFGITKVGAGTTTLSAANTYTGQTTVGAGTLLLASTGSISGSSLIQIQSGATLNASAVTGGFQLASGQKLQNTGTFLGNLTAQSGSTYAPGNSPGISTQSANLTLNTGSTFEFELVANTTSGAGINFDQTQFTVANTTDLTIQSGVNASLVFNFTGSTVNWANTFWDADRSWLVFTGADTSTFGGGSGIFSGTQTVGVDSLGNSLTGARGSFAFTNTGPEVFLNYTAIPEPSTYAMLGLGLAALVWLRRKNKKS